MVDILLATYNSEKFIIEQLESIFTQDFTDWTLLIRDGGSTDSTLSIIEGYQKKYPDKIKIIPSNGRAGYVENFSHLLTASSADTVMFCDHDDVWLKEKVSKSVAKLLEMETEHSKDTPILVHCEASIVDENLNIIADNMHKHWHFKCLPSYQSMPIEIPVFGCSIAINKALIDLASPIPLDGGGHDMWVGRIAWFLGKVGYIEESLILYRVHGRNASEAAVHSYPMTLFRWCPKIITMRQRIYDQFIHPTNLFVKRYHDKIPTQYLNMLTAFGSFGECNILKRKYLIIRHRIHANGWARTLGLFLIV